MLGIEPNKEKQKRQTVSPVMAGVAGMIAGATAVTALVLTDEDIRKKAVKRAKETKNNLHKWSDNKLHEYKAKSHQASEKVEELQEEAEQLQDKKISN